MSDARYPIGELNRMSSQLSRNGGPTMATETVGDTFEEQAKLYAAKRGSLGAVNFALIVGTLLGTGWSIWAWVR